MRANSVILDVVFGVTILGLGMWLAVEHQARARLEREHAALVQQIEQMSARITKGRELTTLAGNANQTRPAPDEQALELLRLRGQVGVLREQCKELEKVRSDNRLAHSRLESRAMATADYWPRDSWSFTGYGSPDAALQSSLWAASNGDLKALLASMTGDSRKMVEADLNGKSPEEASIKAMDEVINYKSVRVLNRETQADDAVVLTVAIEDKTDTQTVKLLMKKVGNEWKISGPPQ